MKKATLLAVTLSVMVMFISTASVSYADFTSNPLVGPAPTINGAVGPSEWQGAYQLHLTPAAGYPIETYVYFLNDATNLYVLVDAIDDQTAGVVDECLLVFGLPPAPNYHAIEIWGVPSSPDQVFSNGASGSSAKGFGTSPDGPIAHRIYEFQINLASIGLTPGGSTEFYSPASVKFGGIHYASMPYDDATTRDNVYPVGLSATASGSPAIISAVSGYDTITAASNFSIPTLSEWGMIIFFAFLALSGLIYGRRKRRTAQ
ncbi:MAG: hypothetical protein E4H15_00960 [Syntrophobacterales bacterium]|nr:MAG: hypothetical protein E4H15_00960 [Syntrophobacterales bacterium]